MQTIDKGFNRIHDRELGDLVEELGGYNHDQLETWLKFKNLEFLFLTCEKPSYTPKEKIEIKSTAGTAPPNKSRSLPQYTSAEVEVKKIIEVYEKEHEKSLYTCSFLLILLYLIYSLYFISF
jgi:hypothetical protein